MVELAQLSSNKVNENSPNGTIIADLSTTNADAGDTHTYTLLYDAEGRFALNDNQLVVGNGSLLDF